jgi:hypothetical protein
MTFSLPTPTPHNRIRRYMVQTSIEQALQAWEDGDSSRFTHHINHAEWLNGLIDPAFRVDLWRAQYEPDYLKSLSENLPPFTRLPYS